MRRAFFLCSFLLLGVSSAFAQGCPMCKESMTQAGEKLSNGFYLSIVSMATLPFLLIGGIGTIVVKSWWQRTHPGEVFSLLRLVRGRK
jgi:hypothetical protein